MIACAVLAGCSSVNSVERAEPQSRAQVVKDKRIITDSTLDGYACVVAVNEGVAAGRLPKVQVKIANKTSGYRTVNYKFSWFDENGMEISSPSSPWLTLALEGGESRFVSDVAVSPKAKDFSLKLLSDVRNY